MSGSSDVYVTFGGDTAGLEAATALAAAQVKAFQKELNSLASEMQKTGQTMDSELGQKMHLFGQHLSEAKEKVGGLKSELNGIGEEKGGGLAGMVEHLKGMMNPISEAKAAFGELAEFIIAAFAGEKIIEFVKSMGELGEATERSSKILGLSTEKIGELNFVAKMTGTNTENLAMMMGRFEVSLTAAEKGTGRTAAGLKALGLTAHELIGIPLDEQLRKIADATAKFEDGTAKMAALQALGRGFVELIPLLDEGSAGIDRLREKFEATNSVLNEVTTARLVDMNHRMTELGASVQGVANNAFTPFINVVNGAVKLMTDWAHEISDSIKSGGDFAIIIELISETFQGVEEIIARVIWIVKQFWEAGSAAAEVVGIAFTALGQKIAAIFRALAAAIPAFFSGLVQAGTEAAHAVGQQFADLGQVISDGLHGNFAAASAGFAKMGTDAGAATDKIKGAFAGVFDFSEVDRINADASAQMVKRWHEGELNILANDRDMKSQHDAIWGNKSEYDNAEGNGKDVKKPPVPNLDPTTMGGKKGGKGNHDELSAALQEADGEVKAVEDATKQKIALYDAQAKRHEITETQKLQFTADALRQGLTQEEDILKRELEMDGLKPQQRQKILNQMAQMERDYAKEIQKINQEAAQKSYEAWQSVTNAINSSITGQLHGVLTGATSIASALKNVFAQLTESMIKFFIDWGLKQAEAKLFGIAQNAGLVTAQIAGNEAVLVSKATTDAASSVASSASFAKSILSSAAETFGGVFAFLSPVMGPAAAGPAAASEALVMSHGLMSFDTGSWSVPHDMLAAIHKDEVVIPARGGLASEFRSIAGNGGFQGGQQAQQPSAQAGDVHNHWSISAIDAQSVAQLFRTHGKELAKTVSGHFNSSPSLRPGF